MGIAGPIVSCLYDLHESGTLRKYTSVVELGVQRVKGILPPCTARAFYKQLGFVVYDTIDAGGNATILADLNRPVPHERMYGLVTNFGTSEHVFNQHQVFQTVHELCQVRGLMFHALPCSGWKDHGLYLYRSQFFDALTVANRYKQVLKEWWMHPSGRGDLLLVLLEKQTREAFRSLYDPVCIKTCKVEGYERQGARRDTDEE